VRSRQYERDVLAPGNRKPKPGQGPVPEIEAERDLVVEDTAERFCGAVVVIDSGAVTLEDRFGKRRVFPLPGVFLLDGKRVRLVRQKPNAAPAAGSRRSRPTRTASGSIAAPAQRAKVAKPSRIYVEGKHDAELVEKIWGDDLRDQAVVVEYLEGINDLPAIVTDFHPEPGRRLGVLVDHLVPGSKESRIAAAAAKDPNVLIVGHPFIDIWAAIKPAKLALKAWPEVPHGEPWKEGVLKRIGWPHATPQDVAMAWRRILATVTSYTDLEPELLGRVEELIDFVTAELRQIADDRVGKKAALERQYQSPVRECGRVGEARINRSFGIVKSGTTEEGQGQALGEPGAEHYLFHFPLGGGQPLAGRGRGVAGRQALRVGRGVADVPPADAADVAVRAGAEPPPLATGPVELVVPAA
jgi:hypothetical protein